MAAAAGLRALGTRMAPTKTGFIALPAIIGVLDGTVNPHGEGSNRLLWTSERDDYNRPLTFRIVQMTATTRANIVPDALAIVVTTAHLAVGFVRHKG
ncbi:hypothetical protein [Hymenobacter volaticus]|uniref:Uncharacterized protein n=1 Tax=Hymenobacter volaticus TaxID=2932254 RepID=A0ABY4GDJ8_9BACT|nr:hypothetical protein [Hymenobacter volaticus]UOQ68995.1 hypothetical protein MUN86_26175 [Hymenobacter volaticus]